MSADIYTNVLDVRIGGSPLSARLARQLLVARVESSINLPSAFQLMFSDPTSDLLRSNPQVTVGAKVQLVPIAAGKPATKPLLTGEITALEMDADRTGRTVLVRGYDPAHRLQRNRRVAGYPNMTAADIVRKLAGATGVKLGTVDSTRAVYELATQPNITDWDFLTRLAMENDVYLYVDRSGQLQFTALKDASGAPADTTSSERSPYVLEFGKNVLQCRVGLTSSGQASNVTVRGWDVNTKRALTAQASAARSDSVQLDVTAGTLAKPFGTVELTDAEQPYTTQAQVQNAATALADDVASSFAELEISVIGAPELAPGVPVALNGAGTPFEGKYTVTSARHMFVTGERYTTWVEVSGRQFRSLYGLTSGAASAAPTLPGVVNAVVSNIKDPTNKGKVKLRFPWLSDTYESDWCRVAQFGGVKGGGLLLPEVDDEVLVAFDRGALEHPYVLAGLYNGVDNPTPDPDRLDPIDPVSGAVNWRSLASRGGHTISLLDAPTRANTGIRLQTGNGGLTLHLDQTKTTITVRSNGSVSINGALGVTVEAGADLNLNAAGAVNISGGGAVNLKAGGELGLNAGGAISVSAIGATTLESVGPTAISGTSDISIQAPAVTLTGGVVANGIPI